MKAIVCPLLCILLVSLSAFVVFSSWKVKAGEATVKFSSGKIKGSFTGLNAEIVFDKEHPEQARISATIAAPSIATGFFLKNSHAKDALGADKYPTIKFVSTSVIKSAGAYLAKGNLTMKGVTKPVTIYFTFDDKDNQGVFKGKLTVSPKDFGIDRNGTPDKVMVDLTVPVTKA